VPAIGSEPIPGIFLTPPDTSFGGPARFVHQPQSYNTRVGDSINLVAAAIGQEPITYQWQRDGTDLPGATQRVLSFSNLRPADAGSYRVIARNALGGELQPALLSDICRPRRPSAIPAERTFLLP
jgi:hypothetical protein